jgi:hypothetical protein
LRSLPKCPAQISIAAFSVATALIRGRLPFAVDWNWLFGRRSAPAAIAGWGYEIKIIWDTLLEVAIKLLVQNSNVSVAWMKI